MKKIYKKATFDLNIDKNIVPYNESCTVTFTASGEDMVEGLEIPYRILSGPSPYGSSLLLIDFTYNKDTDYYYLNVILSEDLGTNILSVTQTNGPQVVLEKVSDLIYKYKNPLDRDEVERTFRATLNTLASNGDLIPGVRAFDFVYSNEYGYFKLDSDLKCVKTFKNKMSLLSPVDRVFNISLYYMPENTASTLFSNNYTPPIPYPDLPQNIKPKLTVEAVFDNIFEGEDAVFKISYSNVRRGYRLKYSYLDTKDAYDQSGELLTEVEGFTIIRIPTTILPINTTASRYLSLWLKDYPHISAKVFINIIPIEKYNKRFPPGVYTIPVQPYTSYEITLIAGGGAGGASVNNRGGNWNVYAVGGTGGESSIELNGSIAIAKGGLGGTDGHWHNGSSFHQGYTQNPVPNDIYGIGSTFVVKTNVTGNKGVVLSRWNAQVGAPPVTDLGDEGYNGKGGTGGWGVGDENHAFGAAGGSGGLLIVTYRNDTSRILELKLTVGDIGKIFNLGFSNSWGNNGTNGLPGFAIVKAI